MYSKLPHVGTTIFTVMSALSAQHKAINLGQGFPDFPMDEALTDLVAKAMRDGHNQYAHMCGLPILRERIAEKIHGLYGADVSPESEITITPGGTYAIYTAFTSILQPGDEVIVFEPAYDSYIPNIEINGGIAVTISLEYPDYSINWELVRSKITHRTKAIILNSPHNPTGSILNENDIQELRKTVQGTDIFIISDEVYEHLIFESKAHLSILRYPDLFARSFVCFSFGKVYHCTGWKLGYCIAPESLMTEFRKVHQFNVFTCNSPMQVAISEYMLKKEKYLELGSLLQQKRDYFQELMQQTPLRPLRTFGSYFQLYSYDGLSEQTEKEYAKTLTELAGVTTIPVSAFYRKEEDHKVLRFCFAKQESTLQSAAERLTHFYQRG